MRSLRIILAVAASWSVMLSGALGLPDKAAHIFNWSACLGLQNSRSKEVFRPVFDEFSYCIDNVTAFRNGIKDYTCSHRLLMHWGFNMTDPKNHIPLALDIERKLRGRPDKEQVKARILSQIHDEWVRRNRRMIDATQRALKLPHRMKTRALATLIYDIHVIADHTTPDYHSVADLRLIVAKDLLPLGIERLFRGTIAQDEADELISIVREINKGRVDLDYMPSLETDLTRAFSSPPNIQSLSPSQQKAAMVLVALHRSLPGLLSKAFGNHFGEIGVSFNTVSDMNTEEVLHE